MTDSHFSLADDQHSISTYNTDGLWNALGKGLVIVERVHRSCALNNSQKESYSTRKFLIWRPINPTKNEECKGRQAAELQPRQAEGLVGLRQIKALRVYP